MSILKKICKEDLLKFKQSLVSDKSELNVMIEEDIIQKPSFIDKVLIKEKLTVDNQIKYLKFKGITFNYCNESIAKDILENRTYYYKVTAFRKNFKKENNKYQNVDFGVLNDLATIDMHFRYLFLKLSLDIEHNIKALLIKLITESDEDGYEIVEEYKNFEIAKYREKLVRSVRGFSDEEIERRVINYKTIDKKLMESYKSPRDYSYDLINKRKDKPSIWVLIELMSYGQLAYFINFYVESKKFKYRELNLAKSLLLDSKNIRDSSAHSRPILFNIVGPNELLILHEKRPKLQVKNYLTQKCNLKDTLVDTKIRNLKIHDISALLYLHDHYVNGKITRIERKKELLNLIKRCRIKQFYYDNQSEFGCVLYMFLKIIKNYNVKK